MKPFFKRNLIISLEFIGILITSLILYTLIRIKSIVFLNPQIIFSCQCSISS
nr:MAG TPA_asm: hypothetical protein [Caudoviricetes sp.]